MQLHNGTLTITENADDGIEHIAAVLSTAREEAARLATDLTKLQSRLDAAREAGTPPQTRAETQDARSAIEAALSKESMDVAQLARATGESVGRVGGLIRSLRDAGKVHNVGSADHPMWAWRIGDDTEARVLIERVRVLISERPMTTRELVSATGARPSRVSGALVAIQRGTDKVLDLGSPRLGRWFLVPEARVARLKPKHAA